MSIRFRRGLSVNRPSITPQAGEPLYDVDTHKLYVGDGATAGGVPVDTDGGIDTYVRTVNGSDGDVTVNKSTVGLGNVNNTSDANKPVSTAQAAALALKADASSLSSVATSGSYNSLSDKPTIPAAQVQADWGAANGVAHILNKPNLAAVATTGSYNDLTNKPTIPVITGKADITYVDAQDTSVASTAQSNLTAHTSNTSNPHSVTKAQVGLGNVDNTSDANKPVSTAQAAADATKASKAGDTMTGRLQNSTSNMAISNTRGGKEILFGASSVGNFTAYDNTNGVEFFNAMSDGSGIRLGTSTGVAYLKGTGFPNGVVSAPVGSIYIDKAVTNGASSWIKKSGTGNTGWKILEGDTGWRNVTSLANVGSIVSGNLHIRRVGNIVEVAVIGCAAATANELLITNLSTNMPGFTPYSTVAGPITGFGTPSISGYLIVGGGSSGGIKLNAGTAARWSMASYTTTSDWPATLPGTAV